MPAAIQVLPGARFGRLTVVCEARRGKPYREVQAACDCGTAVVVAWGSLRYGRTKSCGCLRRDVAASSPGPIPRHGHAVGGDTTGTYKSWKSMRERCRNPRAINFEDYGGRGITVCDRWASFDAFLGDMGERPDGMTLDRIDVDGDYEPANCRWATASEQRRNQRRHIEVAA